MTEIQIEYCVPCGLLDRAQDVQRDILDEYGQSIDKVSLKTGDGGVFKISVDGEKIYDKEEDEYDFDIVKEKIDRQVDLSA